MRKILLVDGNSVLFRAYYGTLNRDKMRSSSGVVTNAVYGFSTMLKRAIEILTPTHVMVAFDTGDKTFRHDMYPFYKGTRREVDEELVSQFALVREYLDACPILRYEVSGYEADDIIGTMAKRYCDDEITILSSDRDLLQIVDDHVDVLLMKKGLTEFDRITPQVLKETKGIEPSQIIDMKALMGDSSDNIPGIPSVGEKTALKLITQYQSLDGVYAHQDAITGKLGERIREYKEVAYLSQHLATIYCDVPINIEDSDFYLETNQMSTNAFFRKYDMLSLVKDEVVHEQTSLQEGLYEDILRAQRIAVRVETDDQGQFVGVAISDGKAVSYLNDAEFARFKEVLADTKHQFIVSDAKILYRLLLDDGMNVQQNMFDDVVLLAFIVDGTLTSFDKLKDSFDLWDQSLDARSQVLKDALNMFSVYDNLERRSKVLDVDSVYSTIEKPLVSVLAKCEHAGFMVDQEVLDKIAKDTEALLEEVSQRIYKYAYRTFNLNSPKQLAEVLFDDIGLKPGKKRSTAVDVLERLAPEHPIINDILAYRKYQKLYSAYAVGLVKHISSDSKIHTTLNQHLAQTGRLSSSNPNLQNVSVRDEEGKMVRAAFVASKGRTLLKIDYSQIELRVLAFLANEAKMIDVFKQGRDIHMETAREIFAVNEPTSIQRRGAKSVNFGIVYGMSEYGLAQQLDISIEEAKAYIDKHKLIYPRIHAYMDELVAHCEKKGYVETYFKRRRYIPEISDHNYASREFGKRAAMNAPVQGTAADIIKMAMIQVDKVLDAYASTMILQVHDELIFDVVDEEMSVLKPLIINIMENIVSWPVALKVSATTGRTWLD